MGEYSGNSDAIQFMHPLMSLIMAESRGGILELLTQRIKRPLSYLLHLSMADETDSSKEICTDAFYYRRRSG
jgi:hypothetical protein